MQRDEVGAAVELVVVDVLVDDALVHELLVGIEVGAQDLHAEALADAAERGADATGADDAGGLAVQRVAHEAVEGEVVLADADVALADAAVGGQGERHGVLGDGLGRVGGDAGDPDAEVLGDGDVHGVKARAAHQEELHAKAGEDLEGHGAAVGVDEGTDRVVAAGERGGHGGEVGLGEVDLDLGVLGELLGERRLVVAGGTKEEDVHERSFPCARTRARIPYEAQV